MHLNRPRLLYIGSPQEDAWKIMGIPFRGKFEPFFPLDVDFKVVTNRFLFDVVVVAGEEARKDDFNLFLAGLVIAFKEIDLVKI